MRQFQMGLILGAPASGKSTLMSQLINRYKHQKVIIDPNKYFMSRGYTEAVWPADGDVQGLLAALKAKREKEGKPPILIALDDADRFMTGSVPQGVYKDLVTSFRHWNADVLLNSRRTQGVPKDVVASADTLYLFRQREVHALAYLERMLGKEVVRHIPKVPYHYLRVNVDSGEMWHGVTVAPDA